MIPLRLVLPVLLFLLAPAARADLLVFAAASLKEPLDRIAAAHGDVTISYGGSGTLARQVLAGAPADVVILAHPQWTSELMLSGRASIGFDILTNDLVLIAPSGAGPTELTPDALQSRLGPEGRLAIGFTGSVPAGIYGREALQSLGLWETLRPRLAEVDSVRAALALVARGEAPLGITYATDARVSEAVEVAAVFPTDSHGRILYSALLMGAATPEARAFVDALRAPDGKAIFAEAGFTPLDFLR